MAARRRAARSNGAAGNGKPAPATYTLESAFGEFGWDDPATGTARYVDGGVWVRQTIRYLDTVASDTDPNILYYAFAETVAEADGRTRKWMFETKPRAAQTMFAVYFGFDQNLDTLTFAGWATKTMTPPHARPSAVP
jgi:hypothetical protein